MTASHENDYPAFNPMWERAKVLADIREAFSDNIAQSAVHLTDDLQAITTLSGPVETETLSGYEHRPRVAVYVVRVLSLDGKKDIVEIFFTNIHSEAVQYNLNPNPAELDTLDASSAYEDSEIMRLLGRARFDSFMSDRYLGALMRSDYFDRTGLLKPID